ncbi:MAG: DASS family sodium-coupled anion symporter [Bacteroidota bacterium]|nr:DASS family sodium-coupled anion symporter [Bacteroidota bacterium]
MQLKFSRQVFALLCVGAALLIYVLNPFGVKPEAAVVIAFATLMIGLWVTEALPMPVVALLPLILFPLFGVAPIATTAASYANPVIFLFMGGFMLGLAIEKWNLHRRIALNIVRLTGTSGDRIILGFIISTGSISMWLSNTATTMMMFPIALSVVKVMEENHAEKKGMANFAMSIMIAIALASNFGGIATIIGTPPNVAYAGFYNKRYNETIAFADWVLLCMPLSLLLMGILYLVMVKWLYPNGMKNDAATGSIIHSELAALGPFTLPEKRVFLIFLATALLWITKDLINKWSPLKLDDNMIAIMGATALFITPSGRKNESLLEWSDTRNMAWGILLLFGGGIALATALENVGLIQQLGQWFAQFGFSTFMLIFLVTVVSMFISEVMSNVAQVIVFAPVVSGLAEAAHIHPLLLGIPMTLAASCASMLPMGTPPNAIAFSSGYIKLKQMTRIGFIMNIIAVILITLFCWLLLPLIFPLAL